MASSFADLLKNVNSRLGYNADEPGKQDPLVEEKLSFGAKCRDGITFELERKTEISYEDAKDGAASPPPAKIAKKSQSKMKMNLCGVDTTLTLANEKVAADLKTKLLEQDGLRVDLGLGGEAKEQGKYKVKGSLDVQASDLGGAKLNMNVPVEGNEKKELSIKPKINLEVNKDVNVGVAIQTDGNMTMKEVMPQIIYRIMGDAKAFSFARADLTRKQIMMGCDVKETNFSHSHQLTYSRDEKFEGFMGLPVSGSGGIDYDLTEATSLKATGKLAKTISGRVELAHKYDQNWTLSATQTFDSAKLDGSKGGPYHIGFAASYKL